jgi:3-oxoacyl-[acyl-carrier protein] reductase
VRPEDLERNSGIAGPQESEAGEVVEALLEEVNEETQPQPAGHLAGLRGRTLVVTGGGSGLGRRIAIEFARCGVNVAFNWYDVPGRSIAEEAERTEAELQQLEVRVISARVDVRDAQAVGAFIRRVSDELGPIHFLVNAAGVHRSSPVWEMSEADWREVLDVNLTGAFNMIRAVAPLFRSQRHGKIVNIASIQAFSPGFGVANYAASKSGLAGLTRATAMDLGPSNVNVNGVAPGFVRTGMLSDVPDRVVKEAETRAALRRLPEPADVAHVAVFLCSEMARGISGQVIRVDSGLPG